MSSDEEDQDEVTIEKRAEEESEPREPTPEEQAEAQAEREAEAQALYERREQDPTYGRPDVGEPKYRSRRNGRLTMMEQIKLARRIVTSRHRQPQPTFEEIAFEEGIPIAQASAIYHAAMEQNDDESDPMTMIDETVAIYSESLMKLSYEAEFGDNSSSRVGATKILIETARARMELLTILGRIPRAVGMQAQSFDIGKILDRMVEVIQAHNLPDQVVKDMIQVIESGNMEAQRLTDDRTTDANATVELEAHVVPEGDGDSGDGDA